MGREGPYFLYSTIFKTLVVRAEKARLNVLHKDEICCIDNAREKRNSLFARNPKPKMQNNCQNPKSCFQNKPIPC